MLKKILTALFIIGSMNVSMAISTPSIETSSDLGIDGLGNLIPTGIHISTPASGYGICNADRKMLSWFLASPCIGYGNTWYFIYIR